MFDVTRSFYKSSPSYGGMLYAWFPSMHTRTDIILCGKQTKKELLLVVDAIYERLSYIEKLGNCYDADSELARLNRVAALRPQPVSCELYDMLAFCLAEVRGSQKWGGVVENLEPGVIPAEGKSYLFSPVQDKIWWLFRENTLPQRKKAPDV